MQSAPPADAGLDGSALRSASSVDPPAAVAQDHGNPTWVLLAALAGMFATTFPITILTVSLGSVAREFGTSETTIAWVISGPMLLSAVALPLLGKLGDLYGHRRIFLLGFAGATVTAGLTALAWSPFSLIGLRTLAAVLGGATQPASMAMIFAVYPPEKRVRAMGWWSMTGAAAPALGLLAGGPLVDYFGWRIVFVLQAGFSLLAWVVAAWVLRETPRQRVRFDLLGAFALALGVGGWMFALGQARDHELTSLPILLAIAVGAVGILFFVAVERRVESPLLPLSFFRLPGFTAAILSNAAMSAAYMGAFVIAPLVLLEEFGFTISIAAAIMLLRTASLTVASPFGGSVGQRFGERVAAVVGSSIMTAGLGFVCLGSWNVSLPLFGVGLVLQGVGHGLALPSLTSAISHVVSEADLGVASAANRLTGQVGAAFGITLLAIVYGGRNEPAAFGMAFAAGAVLSAFSLLAAAWMRAGHPSR
ncbi:MAG: MFS transporter [Myxococcales bacterium]|nr:MFS transporter [Myxococcales bacterium]